MEDQVLIIPIGNSPAHSYRIWKSLKADYSNCIFICTSKTKPYANQILSLCNTKNVEIITIEDSNEEGILFGSSSGKHSIVFGPGTHEMALKIWTDSINSNEEFPEIILMHQKLSSRGNVLSQHLGNSKLNGQTWDISSVSEDEAIQIYNISKEDVMKYKLQWDSRVCKFTYTISVPDKVRNYSLAASARKWAIKQIVIVENLREKFGKHAINYKREPFPNRPRFWQSISERMNDHSITGGFL